MQVNELKNNLPYISKNVHIFVEVVNKLETLNLKIIESLTIAENGAYKLHEIQEESGVDENTE